MRRLERAGVASTSRRGRSSREPGAGGIGLLSRLPLRRGRPDVPGAGSPRPSSTVARRTARPDQGRPPAPAGQPRRRAPVARRARARCPAPTSAGDVQILAGDFNATLDHRELRALLDRGYTDAADAAGDGWRPPGPPRRAATARSR